MKMSPPLLMMPSEFTTAWYFVETKPDHFVRSLRRIRLHNDSSLDTGQRGSVFVLQNKVVHPRLYRVPWLPCQSRRQSWKGHREGLQGTKLGGSLDAAHARTGSVCEDGDTVGTCEYGARAGDHATGVATEAPGADGSEATSSTAAPAATGGDGTPAAAAAAAPGGENGNCRSGKTSAARVEPAVVPPSVHYGVYVNNIPLDVEDDQLKALFKPYGE
ncbi:hypothetical protein MTO96_049414, partial [Rhipicephalus appendiculatus]